MKNKFLYLTAAALISSVTIAHAADVVYQTPEAPVYDEATIWGGAYIGGQVGYNWARSRLSSPDFTDDLKVSPSGFIGGIYAGYNWEFSNAYLFGIEADLNYTDLSKTANFGQAPFEAAYTPRVEFEGAVRARFGVNYDRWLPYIAGGVSFARVKDNVLLTTPANTISIEQTDTRVGFTIGAGLDYALTNNLILRAEYRYADYGKRSFANGDNDEVKLTTNNVRLGIAYKF